MTVVPKKIVPPRVFDRLRAAVDRFGGVGSGSMYVDSTPRCGIGFVDYIGAIPEPVKQAAREELLAEYRYTAESYLYQSPVRAFVRDLLGLDGWIHNDTLVSELRTELGLPLTCRVPFDAWASRLGLVRGREIPAKVYDAIERQAAIHGGVGRNTMYKGADCPVCGIGLAHAGGAVVVTPAPSAYGPAWQLIDDALYSPAVFQQCGFDFVQSDTAVDAVCQRRGIIPDMNTRVSFEDWADELNLVRGAE